MKLEVYVNGEPTEIMLTASQIEKVRNFNMPIMDRIKTLQDALDYNGETIEQFYIRTQYDADHEKAYKELCAIALALNEGKPMNYKNTKEYKYYPYFYAAGSGSGFSFFDYCCAYVRSYVGARLCVNTPEKAEYMGKQFIETYNRFING